MKKILFTFTVLTLCYSLSYAQFGITGGMNIAKYKYTSDRGDLLAFNAGLVYRIAQKKSMLVVQPQLLYTIKGAVKYPDIDLDNDILKYTNRVRYAELSVPFIVSPDIDGGDGLIRFEAGVGPYVAYATHATYNAETYEGDKSSGDFKIGGSNTDDFKPFDAGLSLVGAMKVANFSFNLQYDLGLSNANPVKTAPPLKMRAFMLNLIVFFGK